MSTQKITLNVANMHCPSCPKLIIMDLEDKEGILKAEASLEAKTVTVEFDPKKINTELIIKTIEDTGYQATLRN